MCIIWATKLLEFNVHGIDERCCFLYWLFHAFFKPAQFHAVRFLSIENVLIITPFFYYFYFIYLCYKEKLLHYMHGYFYVKFKPPPFPPKRLSKEERLYRFFFKHFSKQQYTTFLKYHPDYNALKNLVKENHIRCSQSHQYHI